MMSPLGGGSNPTPGATATTRARERSHIGGFDSVVLEFSLDRYGFVTVVSPSIL